jgi:hypothetical protein
MSQESGRLLLLQSTAVPFAMSVASSMPLPLQSKIDWLM